MESTLVAAQSSHRFPRAPLLWVLLLFLGCTQNDEALKREFSKLVLERPEVLSEIIVENPALFNEAMQKAFTHSRNFLAQERARQQEMEFAQSFHEPLRPHLRGDEVVRGNPAGSLVLVEYVDFECPFCKRGQEAIRELQRRYPKELKIVLKHMPLSFHPLALPSARYFEALRLQRADYALSFYESVFLNQSKLRRGDIFLSEMAQDVGADMEQLTLDLAQSRLINTRIQEDLAEARAFGFQGTPSYVLGGIPIRGAYPVEHFIKVVRELKKRKMLSGVP